MGRRFDLPEDERRTRRWGGEGKVERIEREEGRKLIVEEWIRLLLILLRHEFRPRKGLVWVWQLHHFLEQQLVGLGAKKDAKEWVQCRRRTCRTTRELSSRELGCRLRRRWRWKRVWIEEDEDDKRWKHGCRHWRTSTSVGK